MRLFQQFSHRARNHAGRDRAAEGNGLLLAGAVDRIERDRCLGVAQSRQLRSDDIRDFSLVSSQHGDVMLFHKLLGRLGV